jgi:DNA-binding transcriptional LysR family regulator
MSGLGITVLPRVSVEHKLTQNLLTEVPWQGHPLKVFTQIAYHKDKWLRLLF